MAARARGLRAVFVPTGQTGAAIAGWGIAVDHVSSDYVSGAAEWLVDMAARAAVAAAEQRCGVVADDAVRFGPERILDAILAELETG